MDHVLRADGWSSLAKGTSSLAQVLARRDGAWMVEGDGDRGAHFLALRIANMAFAQDGYALEQAYMERVSRTFRSGVGLVDYVGRDGRRSGGHQPLGRRADAWAASRSCSTPPDVTDATRLVLVNAVYFKGEWVVPFEEGNTVPHTFTTAAGKEIRVPTMETFGGQAIPLASGDGWRATELAYQSPDDAPARDDDRRAGQPGRVREGRSTATGWRPSRRPLPASSAGSSVVRPSRRTRRTAASTRTTARVFLPKFGTETRAEPRGRRCRRWACRSRSTRPVRTSAP